MKRFGCFWTGISRNNDIVAVSAYFNVFVVEFILSHIVCGGCVVGIESSCWLYWTLMISQYTITILYTIYSLLIDFTWLIWLSSVFRLLLVDVFMTVEISVGVTEGDGVPITVNKER